MILFRFVLQCKDELIKLLKEYNIGVGIMFLVFRINKFDLIIRYKAVMTEF